MDWNKLAVLGAEVVVFVTLAVLVGLGHDSAVLDGLMAVGGILTGTGIWHNVTQASASSKAASSDQGAPKTS